MKVPSVTESDATPTPALSLINRFQPLAELQQGTTPDLEPRANEVYKYKPPHRRASSVASGTEPDPMTNHTSTVHPVHGSGFDRGDAMPPRPGPLPSIPSLAPPFTLSRLGF